MKRKTKIEKGRSVVFKRIKFSLTIPEFRVGFSAYLLFGLLYLMFISLVLSFIKSPLPTINSYHANPEVAGESTENLLPAPKIIIPKFIGDSSVPFLSAESIVVQDIHSNTILYEKDSDKKMLPASTTKILTALVVLDYYPLDMVIQVNGNVFYGQKMGLVTGEQITVENLLYGLLVYSANDAASVLAYNYPGGEAKFIEDMNSKAQVIGMKNSKFSNPSGFDGVEHYSTARDLVILSRFAMDNSVIRKMVSTKEITVSSIDGKYVHKLKNINQLVGTVEGVIGIKTGWTENAKENLITYIIRDNAEIIISLLGSNDRFLDTKTLIDWVFMNYSWVQY